MQINKKVLLSILAIGILACVASAGTWAYYQDTITSSGNKINTASLMTQYSIDGSGYKDIENGAFNIPGVDVQILPTKSSDLITMKQIKLRNNNPKDGDGISTDIYLKVTPSSPIVAIPGLVIQVDGGTSRFTGNNIYNGDLAANRCWLSQYTKPTGQYICNLAPGAEQDISLKYNFLDSGENQNSLEGQTVNFGITFYVVPADSVPHA